MEDEELFKQRVAQVFVAFYEGPNFENTTPEKIAAQLGADPQLVVWALRELRIPVSGGVIHFSTALLPDLKRVAHFAPKRPAQPTTHNTINNYGNNVQAAAGGDITGTMNVTISYEHILNQLIKDVEASNIPAEKKKGIVDAAKALGKEVGSLAFKATVGELVKSAYAHSSQLPELLHRVTTGL